MHMLVLSYTTVACSFCLLVSLIFKGLYIHSCLLFWLGCLFVCFSCFFLVHFDISNFHCLLLQNMWRPQFPVSRSSLCFLTAFCFDFWLLDIWLLVVLLILFFFIFFNFSLFLFCFPPKTGTTSRTETRINPTLKTRITETT